jgi:hypothetical protein
LDNNGREKAWPGLAVTPFAVYGGGLAAGGLMKKQG